MYDFSTADGFVEVSENLADMIKFVANEPSVGLFYIQQHTHNATPNLLNLKNDVVQKSHETALHAQDLEDSITMLGSMKECGFPIADEMIKEIKKSLSIASTKKPKRGFLGRTSTWSPAMWGQSSFYTRQDSGKTSGYLSGIFKSAKQTADSIKRPQVRRKGMGRSAGEEDFLDFDPMVGSTSKSSPTLVKEAEIEGLPLSSELIIQELSVYKDNYDEFKAEREAKLEEWLGTEEL
ncbi:hypothetical protein OROMI_001432 [Orobanche minor]